MKAWIARCFRGLDFFMLELNAGAVAANRAASVLLFDKSKGSSRSTLLLRETCVEGAATAAPYCGRRTQLQ